MAVTAQEVVGGHSIQEALFSDLTLRLKAVLILGSGTKAGGVLYDTRKERNLRRIQTLNPVSLEQAKVTMIFPQDSTHNSERNLTHCATRYASATIRKSAARGGTDE